MKEETRTPKQIIVLGTNGTGKTTFVKKLVISELKKKDSHVLIVVPDDMEWNTVEYVHPKFPGRINNYVGVRKIIYYPGIFNLIYAKFRNGLIVFDDCRKYIPPQVLDEGLRSIMIRRRQIMCDVVAVTHGFTQVPPEMFTFSTHLVLFRTLDNIDRRKNCITNFDEAKEAVSRINVKALKSPHHYEIIKIV